ncbi:MAG: ACP S-malonyltransferase [Caldicoprobacter oshimai]|uniref:Malonyl CoA-acyl carrier protein transacylase n=1 Tax=Caldicoprobacter faecalis TaxID=937334 RepID=A0A1I5U2V2_9FIRM|nr:ACP S-malonyltransferase [Caldicoprobacter faecalis]PZN10922.1 MAG: [acyl-carrier-protein] S-malonyltransferase [Caldicoprobacter oshimai]SFP89628.1 [acyl-carrier-protein] S-malonyltransferase [Caldicoprobacter faecalis]
MKNKIAFVFPGQGAQYVGMGRELYDNYHEVKELFEKADEILGRNITSICFEGPEDELKKTENTQPAILLVSVAAMMVLEKHGIYPDMVAGLSLGEYAALVAANSISFEDALPLVMKRGQFMQQAVPLGQGMMAAVLGLEREKVEECCRLASDAGVVEPANYNCPGQIVISGHVAAVEKACAIAKEMGAKRTVPLAVSAPFHCSLLKPAGEALEKELDKIHIKDPEIPVVSNVEALPVRDAAHIRKLLVQQVSSPVRWEDSIRYMIKQGIEVFVEVGPGKVLTGFLKKISSEVKVKGYNVEDLKSLESTLKELGGTM